MTAPSRIAVPPPILRIVLFGLLLFHGMCAFGAGWPVELCDVMPSVRMAEEFPKKDGVTPLFYDNGRCRGVETEVFAWLAMPKGASLRHKVPGIVIVHGGGGTAYRAWAALWAQRGYAAIAMDMTGGIPSDDNLDSPTCKFVHAKNGGPNLNKTFQEAALPLEDQWPFHAVQAVVRAHTILQALPQVDDSRIGITGISWGAIIGEIAAALDKRVAFAAFVYGCGFLGDSSFFKDSELDALPDFKRSRWLDNFDPSNYAARISCPVLFVNGATDKHFRPDSWGRTVSLPPQDHVWLSYDIFMRHSHLPACDPPEILHFANSIVMDGPESPRMTEQGVANAVFHAPAGIATATFIWTTDNQAWPNRKWNSMKADVQNGTVSVPSIPDGTTAYFFRIIDANGIPAASRPVVITENASP